MSLAGRLLSFVGQWRLACQLPGGSSMHGALPTPFPTLSPPYPTLPLNASWPFRFAGSPLHR